VTDARGRSSVPPTLCIVMSYAIGGPDGLAGSSVVMAIGIKREVTDGEAHSGLGYPCNAR